MDDVGSPGLLDLSSTAYGRVRKWGLSSEDCSRGFFFLHLLQTFLSHWLFHRLQLISSHLIKHWQRIFSASVCSDSVSFGAKYEEDDGKWTTVFLLIYGKQRFYTLSLCQRKEKGSAVLKNDTCTFLYQVYKKIILVFKDTWTVVD